MILHSLRHIPHTQVAETMEPTTSQKYQLYSSHLFYKYLLNICYIADT